MGKKYKNGSKKTSTVQESSVSPIVELNYPEPLFSVAAHPTQPILVSGLATGHVYCNKYDDERLEESQAAEKERIFSHIKHLSKSELSGSSSSDLQGFQKWWTVVEDLDSIDNSNMFTTAWKTKRHKSSCRSIIFDPLEGSAGNYIFSVGTDHIIKKADTETGKVVSKTSVSQYFEDEKDAVTRLSHSTSHNFLLSGTENGHVFVNDSKDLSSKLKFKVTSAHDDAVNHILPMPSVSAYHYLTLGSTTLSHIDIRKGIVTQSDDQEDELLSMCYPADDSSSDTVLVSHGEGIVTIWKNSKNKLMDQLSRIKINKSTSVDAIISSMNCDDDEMAASVWCGGSDGMLYRVNYKKGKIVETRRHSMAAGKYGAVDEVGSLDIDYNYRLISAGMDTLKIWSGEEQTQIESEAEDSESESLDSDDSDDSKWSGMSDSGFSDKDSNKDSDEEEQKEEKEARGESDESEDDDDDEEQEQEDESEEEEEITPNIVRKKRFTLKSLDSSSKEPKKKKSKIEETKSQPKEKRIEPSVEHGIRKFDDL